MGRPTFTGNPATIESKKTVTVGITNHLNVIPAPALTVDKGGHLADGPFEASLNTTVGTTVYYRITITNTGNVDAERGHPQRQHVQPRHRGLRHPDDARGRRPLRLRLRRRRPPGTTTNIATGDSTETGSDTGTATVVAAAPAPALTVDKGVSLSATGPFRPT